MNNWSDLHKQAELYKKMYPSGTRIMLLHMGKDPMPVDDFTRGTVESVDDIGTVHCIFDNGRKLGMVPGEDHFRKLTEKELNEEQGRVPSLDATVTKAALRGEKTCNPHFQQEPPEADRSL